MLCLTCNFILIVVILYLITSSTIDSVFNSALISCHIQLGLHPSIWAMVRRIWAQTSVDCVSFHFLDILTRLCSCKNDAAGAFGHDFGSSSLMICTF
jgi:hypothetical protein